MPPKTDDTIAFYDAHAAAYADRTARYLEHSTISQFSALIPEGGSILDLGSGGGHDLAAFLGRGFDVVAIDGSAGLAREAEKRTGHPVRVLKFQDLDYRGVFDGAWASASLLHVPPAQLPNVLERIFDALKPGGAFYCSFKATEQDWTDNEGRYFCAMTPQSLSRFLAGAGFVDAEIAEKPAEILVATKPNYKGHPTKWLAALARRP